MSVVSSNGSEKLDLPLPEGWRICESKSRPGKTFYFNVYTREKQWKHPAKGSEVIKNGSRKRRISETSSKVPSSLESYPSSRHTLKNDDPKHALPSLSQKKSLEPLYGARSKITKSRPCSKKTHPDSGPVELGTCKASRIAAWLDKTCEEQGLTARQSTRNQNQRNTTEVRPKPIVPIKKDKLSDVESVSSTKKVQSEDNLHAKTKNIVQTRSRSNLGKIAKFKTSQKKTKETNSDDDVTVLDTSPNKKQCTSTRNVQESNHEDVSSTNNDSSQSFSFTKAYSELQSETEKNSRSGSTSQNTQQATKSSLNVKNDVFPSFSHTTQSPTPSTPSSGSMPGFSPSNVNKDGFNFVTKASSNNTTGVTESVPNKDGNDIFSFSSVNTSGIESTVLNNAGFDFKLNNTEVNSTAFTFGSTPSSLTPSVNTLNEGSSKERESNISQETVPNQDGPCVFESQNEVDVPEEISDAPMNLEDYEMMEVDNAEELQEQILSVLQDIRSEFRPEVIENGEDQSEEMATLAYSDTLYIILDTNVLLSHLKFVMELRDFPVPGVGCTPVLVIPWIVTKELDSLKDHSLTVKHLARLAIRFLSSCYQANHPRVRGQTCVEAAAKIDGFEESNNDDAVLQCCLYFSKQAENGHSILFSNDKNLCNKAIIHGIKAFDKENLISGLKDLFQTALVLKQGNYEEYYNKLDVQERLAKKRAKADELMCELQCIMREGFSAIVEAEMKLAYGDDLWEHIVFIKPPWTFRDLLQLFEKHWIAVFGQVVNRNLQEKVKKLSHHFSDKKGPPSCLYHVKEVLDLVTAVFEAFSIKSNYDGMLPKCIAAVLVLQKKCTDADVGELPKTLTAATDLEGSLTELSSIPPPVTLQTQGAVVLHDGRVPAEITEENSRDDFGNNKVSNNAVNMNYEVLETFNTIWSAVTQFSYQIFSSLDYPHTIPSSVVPPNLQKPTRREALQFLGKLCNHLSPLVTALQGVQMVDRDPNSHRFDTLAQATKAFLKEITQIETKLSAEQFFNFTIDPSTRESLIEGTSQLDRALGMLQHCANCLVRTCGETMF